MKDQQDLQTKRAAITKLGTPVTAWNRNTGVVLSEVSEGVFRVSMSNGGVSFAADVPIADIEVGGVIQKVSTKNEYVEKEDEGCEGGACKI